MPAVLATLVQYFTVFGQLVGLGVQYLPEIIADYQKMVGYLEKYFSGQHFSDDEIAAINTAWETVNKLAAASEDNAEAEEAADQSPPVA